MGQVNEKYFAAAMQGLIAHGVFIAERGLPAAIKYAKEIAKKMSATETPND